MTITEKQARDRKKGIGSSDAAAILGLDNFRGPHDVWREKLGMDEPFAGNEHTRRGDILEPALLEFASVELGRKVVKPKAAFVKGVLRANVDGQCDTYGKGNDIVECKSSVVRDGWGEPGTNQVPHKVAVQVHHQMICAESDVAFVAKLGDWYAFDMYEVPLDLEVAKQIEERLTGWWEKHVVGGVEPAPTATDGTRDWFNQIDRDNDKAVDIDDALIAEYERCSELYKEADKGKKAAKLALEFAMGDATVALGAGRHVKLSTVKGRMGFDSKLFKAHHPELAEKYAKAGSPHTRLYIRENKE